MFGRFRNWNSIAESFADTGSVSIWVSPQTCVKRVPPSVYLCMPHLSAPRLRLRSQANRNWTNGDALRIRCALTHNRCGSTMDAGVMGQA